MKPLIPSSCNLLSTKVFIIATFIFFTQVSISQDIIRLKSGDSLIVIVKDIAPQEVTYKKLGFSVLNPDYKISKSAIRTIYYSDGTKDHFPDSNRNTSLDSTSISENDFTIRGYNDASLFYEGYKSASTLTFVISLYSPIIGLVPAIIFSTAAPKCQKLGTSNSTLLSNSDYRYGYMQKAKRIKQQKVWKNWLIPTSIWVGVITVVSIALSGSRVIP